VKWFQMPVHKLAEPVCRRTIRRLGNEGLGALFRLYHWTLEAGKDQFQRGRAVNAHGDPYAVEDALDACGLAEAAFDQLIEILIDTDEIDAKAWYERHELHFRWLDTATDEYTKRRNRKLQLSQDDTECPDTRRTLDGENPLRGEESTGEESTEDQESAPLLFPVPPSARQREQSLADLWNQLTQPPIPRCQGLSDKRRAQIRRRLHEHTLDEHAEAFRRIQLSAFCRGENDCNWRATFDWYLSSPDVYLKVTEGKYDGRARARSGPSGATGAPVVDKYAALTRRAK
jgi:hypothetical protein